MSYLKSIKDYCIECSGGDIYEVSKCQAHDCLFYFYNSGKNKSNPRVSALKQIRKFCLACGEGTALDVKTCQMDKCEIFKYRFGKDPDRVGQTNEGSFKKKTTGEKGCSRTPT